MKKTSFWRRAASFALALCLSLSLCPALAGTAYAVGEAAMDKLLNWGVVGGYPDGGLHPERSLTRAEFVAMVNRAYGYNQPGETPFIDVTPNTWYYDDIGIAYNAKYFGGVSPRMAAPDSPLTREMALVLLARNMRLDPIAGEVTEFADGRNFADWSRGYARAAAQIGLIAGYGDGSYKPQNDINRGEMAILLQRALGTLVNKPGVHTLSDVYGNVTISSPNATLKDTTVAGDLYITGGLDLGDITLDNVRVLGDIIVAGGGESQSGNDSVILRNVEADSLLVDSIADQYVSLRTEGNTEIGETVLRSDAFIQDRTRPGQGLLNISLESPDVPANFTLSGNLETVVNKTPGSTLNIAMGTVDGLTIDELARNTVLNLDVNSAVTTLSLDTAAQVTGIGDIDTLYVNAAGSTIDMLPDSITIRPGLTADIAGESMNAIQAQESSADPRLLAGYPKAKNIAPTTATAAYSANKAGTVYWAVSTTTDGSIGEEELITPTEGNTAAILSGSTPITASSTETTAALTRLTPDGNYYLTAVMVDARDRHSPVKVVSFTTPDNTTPAFNTGYPIVSQNDYAVGSDGKNLYHIQVSAMPNKTCQLYYALYPAGSTAPTAQQFRVGALGQPIQSGVEDAAKNVISFLDFGGLAETTAYDLYLCLIDADGARSSAVRKLTFTTMDGTPPVLQYNTPEVNQVGATNLRLRVNLNEDGTFYWVAVKTGTDYLKPPTNTTVTIDETGLTAEQIAARKEELLKDRYEEYFKRQIENGVNAARSGSQAVRADVDTNVNLTGLERETGYDIYYIAKDRAGNYSEITMEKVGDGWNMTSNKLTESTLDTNGPEVTQEFTHLDTTAVTGIVPYPDTTIRLVFTENIRRADAADTSDETLLSYQRGTNYDKEKLAAFLNSIVTLKYLNANTSLYTGVPQRTAASAADDDWVIDWRNAVVTRSTTDNSVTVTLSTSSNLAESALRLKSGETYEFEFDNITDVSSARNPMLNTPIPLPEFTTVISQVGLHDSDLATIPVAGDDNYRVDAAFTVTPVSTNAADSVNWDMLVWADRTVQFELYRYETAKDGDGNELGWTKLNADGPVTITVDSSMAAGSFAAVSLRHSIEKVTTSYPKLIDLTDPQYRYAIHITKLGNSEETDFKQWSGDVNLRVSIVTGTYRSLTNMSSGRITEATFAAAQTTSITANRIRDIGTPRPFILPITFEDTTYPTFADNYPRLVEATDTGVNILTRLTGSGTLYYIMIPATEMTNVTHKVTAAAPGGEGEATTVDEATTVSISSISTILDSMGTQEVMIDEDASGSALGTVTITGAGGTKTSAQAFGSDVWQLGTVSTPANDQVHSAGSYYTNESYKIGTPTAAGAYSLNLTRDDLLSDTRYFVYFVTRGEGGQYSPVYTYTFRTPVASPPIITIRQGTGTDNADIEANAATTLTYIVAAYNSVYTNDTLGAPITIPASHPTYTYSGKVTTVLDALITPAYDPVDSTRIIGSVFDFATENDPGLKRQVERYISNTQATATSTVIQTGRDISIAANGSYNVNPSRNMVGSTRYVILAVGRRTLSTSTESVSGYAFAGYYPMVMSDTTPPMVISVSDGELSWDDPVTVDAVPTTVSGKITLSFGEDLYWYNSNQSVKRLVDLASLTKEAGATKSRDEDNYTSVRNLIQGSGSNYMRVTPFNADGLEYSTMGAWFDALVNKSTQVIEIYVSKAQIGTSLTFTAQTLGDANNNVSLVPLVVTITTRLVDGNAQPWVIITPSWNGTGESTRSSAR